MQSLSGLKEHSLILDLNSDLNPDWQRFDNQDLPWVWNMLHNFGGGSNGIRWAAPKY